ncbi:MULTISPECIES: hypothetical protein [unclassified Streptomyces]|uniref:hypothetical protein n=1 Tax=unclassified Streptomyces TaxID=2593676 RepID=UPI0006AD8AA5|nr:MULTISPECIES: hypothetical protein [unclassified Streptomyces]KOX30838.1 hypothetical protein ADL06_11785 [Streptomyces sp. NRRL F-6491]KOX39746.1 hypothetical protein ADL08_24600 [Streptomyces sp. NRRL F-6492]
MRTTARLFTGTALTVAAIGAFAVPAAHAGEEWNGSLEIYPSSASPGTTVTVNTLACGKNGRGVGDANSLGAGDFHLRPSTHKEVVVGQFTVPQHARAGTYGISVACDNGKTARGDLTVTHRRPSGHVQTGVGGSVGPDTTQVAAGAAVLAATAVGGALFLRRRASGARGH